MSRASIASPVAEVVEFFALGPSREEIAAFRLSAAAQKRLRDMIHQNSAGMLSPDEQHELDQMIVLDDVVSLIRARTQRFLSDSNPPIDSSKASSSEAPSQQERQV